MILAIWKQALHICHTQAASAMDGSPSGETTRLRSSRKKQSTPDTEESPDINTQELEDMSSQIEREFLREVEHAEELAKVIEPGMAFGYLIFLTISRTCPFSYMLFSFSYCCFSIILYHQMIPI